MNVNETPVEALGLSYRVYNCAKRAGIDTIGQADCMTDRDMLRNKHFGKVAVNEIRQKVKEYKEAHN